MLDEQSRSQLEYYLPDVSATTKLADFFALFSDGNRLRLLSALSISSLCVSDIALLLKLNQTTVSHQLKLLRNMGLVEFSRDGKCLCYSIADSKVNELLLLGVEHLGY